jgi:hypothetical protein
MEARSQRPVSLAAIRSALSEERLRAYSVPGDGDDLDGVARYLWNGALAKAMVPGLHALEVTLRNRLLDASRKIIDESALSFKEVPCWLDAEPSLLFEKEQASVDEAKGVLRRERKPFTPGRLTSKLSLGFWVGLCRSPYEQGRATGPALWPALVRRAFPFLPRQHRTRPAILQRLEELRELRNRVFHHEPIWDRNLPRHHRRLIDSLAWMNQGVAHAVLEVSRLDAVFTMGPAAYRAMAERLVRP